MPTPTRYIPPLPAKPTKQWNDHMKPKPDKMPPASKKPRPTIPTSGGVGGTVPRNPPSPNAALKDIAMRYLKNRK